MLSQNPVTAHIYKTKPSTISNTFFPFPFSFLLHQSSLSSMETNFNTITTSTSSDRGCSLDFNISTTTYTYSSPSSGTTAPKHPQASHRKRSKLLGINKNASTNSSIISKSKYYSKKSDPTTPKITEPCSECGKKFWSWKALFGHMRCHPERQWRGINPPPNFQRPISPPARPLNSNPFQVSMTQDDHEVATWLIMLANGPREGERMSEDLKGGADLSCRFECLSCKKVFGSHQAFGGHRASHENAKGCFSMMRSDDLDHDHQNADQNDQRDDSNNSRAEEKMVNMGLGFGHKCNVCMRVFSSGQALGGHMRCHWEKVEDPVGIGGRKEEVYGGVFLDLNLPAPVEDESKSSYSSGLTLDLRLGL